MLRREHKVSNISSEAIFAIPAMRPGRVVLAIIFCLVLILSDIRYETSKHFRSYSHDLLKPLYLLVKLPFQVSDSIVDFFTSREELSNRVVSLEDELIKLKTITQYIENMSSDNTELNSLWDSAKFSKDNYLIAEKYSLSPNIFQPSLVLKISNQSNIQKNDPVLVETGLVGRIKGIGYGNAEVMLVQDVRSIVPVVSETSQLQGTLKGNGLGRYGELRYVKKTASFKEGETLYTSGLAEIFPKGAIVGRIISINNPVDSEFLEVKVEFSQSPSNKNFFLIYNDA